MKRLNTYYRNCEYILKRQADYDTRDLLRSKFVAAKDGSLDGFCGNLAAHITINIKTGKAKLNKEWAGSDENNVALYKAIPSALVLYRLCAFDEVKVETFGPEGYKCVWQVGLVHVKSGRLVYFGEHKGAFSFWTQNSADEIKDKAFIKDLCQFITYLCSDKFAHPYDSLVAGSVA